MKNPIRICSSSEMRELDRIADFDYGIDAALLMENAGSAATEVILERYPEAGRKTEILIFAGKGNNAGDAFVLARRLFCLDRRVRVFHFESESRYKGATLKNFLILKKIRVKLTQFETGADLQDFFQSSLGPFTLVDGILGTGLRPQSNLEGLFYETVEILNALNAQEVISLDIPTGVSGDTGSIHGTSILADLTISFGFPKLGHFLPPGASRRGELVNVDISLPAQYKKEGKIFLLTRAPMADLLQERDRYGHKNSFGHALLIGGSPGRVGAISMAAGACHKMGTGLVTVATWKDCFDSMLMKLPHETMAVPLYLQGPEVKLYRENLDQYSSIVIGPGLGLRPDGRLVLETVLNEYRGPIVIDADALNLIADFKLHELLRLRRSPTVLTPHPGEMSRLLGISKEQINQNPLQALNQAVSMTHATVLLKGAATLITSANEIFYLNHYPNDGMATAGSGDVLAGMIAGLLGQKMDPFNGTLLGVYLHSIAGDLAARAHGHRSMTAPDIIDNIGKAFQEIKKEHDTPSMEGRVHLV